MLSKAYQIEARMFLRLRITVTKKRLKTSTHLKVLFTNTTNNQKPYKGFTQTYGIHYTKTIEPVAKLNTVRVFALVYVDDIILIGNNLAEIEKLKKTLPVKFEIKDLGQM